MSESVVITGVGVRAAIGSTHARILQNLRNLSSGISRHRLDKRLDLLFGRVPQEPGDDKADPSKDYAVDCAIQSFEQAKFSSSDVEPDRAAILIGSSKGRLGNLLDALSKGETQDVNFSPTMACYPGDTLGLALAQKYGFSGPVLNYPAACATGITCMIPAIHLLQDHYVDIALAGSAEASGKALIMSSFINMGALSDEIMRPFHRVRKGFNPGEGAGVFLLERESDATARGAKPIARIVGWDFRSDAHHITAADPSGDAIVYSIRKVLNRAGWHPRDVEYINAHGTGTTLNDRVEAIAIHTVFGDHSPPVSSLKPYIGHLLGGSASVELAISIIALHADFRAPTLGLDDPDPEIHLNHVPAAGINGQVQRMLKLSLGFGGHIAVMAIEMLHSDRQ